MCLARGELGQLRSKNALARLIIRKLLDFESQLESEYASLILRRCRPRTKALSLFSVLLFVLVTCHKCKLKICMDFFLGLKMGAKSGLTRGNFRLAQAIYGKQHNQQIFSFPPPVVSPDKSQVKRRFYWFNPVLSSALVIY